MSLNKPAIALQLRHRRGNPRNSEGAFVTLASGRVLFAYSRYYGSSWGDDATARIAARHSDDGGRTWSKRDRVLVDNEGKLNVMSVSLLRLRDGRIGLFYLRKNGVRDCRLWLRTSADEGRTWGRPVVCTPPPGYFVVNNDRVVQTAGGRLIVPAALHRVRWDGTRRQLTCDARAIAMTFHSDDDGRTWHESNDWWSLPVPNRCGLQEPGVVERADGTLYAWARTDIGRQWQMSSADGGTTWTPPEPSRFRAPCSPLSMKRVPGTGDLLAVWNDVRARGERRAAHTSWGRTPLAMALSSNEGRRWRKHRLIETDPRRGFCYVAIHFVDDAALLAYCCGGRGSAVLQDLCIRRVPLAWVYGESDEGETGR